MDMENGSEERQKNGRNRSSGDEEREGVEDIVEEEGFAKVICAAKASARFIE